MRTQSICRLATPFIAALALGFAPRASAQEDPPRIVQVVALDECDPTTFNNAVGADFCKNITLGASTTLSDLFASVASKKPDPGWDFEPDSAEIGNGTILSVVDQAASRTPLLRLPSSVAASSLNSMSRDRKRFPNVWADSRTSQSPGLESSRAAPYGSRTCQKANTCSSAAFIRG